MAPSSREKLSKGSMHRWRGSQLQRRLELPLRPLPIPLEGAEERRQGGVGLCEVWVEP